MCETYFGKYTAVELCLSTSDESTLESSPVEIWSAKSRPGEKRLDFINSPEILPNIK